MEWPESPTQILRARRRLQYSPKSWWSKRGSQDSTNSSIESESKSRKSSVTDPTPNTADNRFLDYVERSGLMSSPELPMGLGSRACIDTKPPQLSPTSPIPKAKSILSRRSARSIMLGKFKSESRTQVVKKRASVELIAEQYRMMLDYKDRLDEGFVYLESQAEPEMPFRKKKLPEIPQLATGIFDAGSSPIYPYNSYAHNDMYDRPRETLLEAPRQIDPPEFSPRSDTTLVSFEEDTIYFKPVSFDSPLPSPAPERQFYEGEISHYKSDEANFPLSHEKELPLPPSSENLQTGLDMLTKELSSSMAGNVSDLQLSVMITAYERLKEQTSRTGDNGMGGMFDCWLGALHNIRNSRGTDAAGDDDRKNTA